MIGTTLAHYTLQELLGEGPSGATYAARDARSNRVVTLKILSPAAAATADQRAAFERDALGACSVNHPYIVPVQEIGSADGVDFLVRDYVSGESLAAMMRASGCDARTPSLSPFRSLTS